MGLRVKPCMITSSGRSSGKANGKSGGHCISFCFSGVHRDLI